METDSEIDIQLQPFPSMSLSPPTNKLIWFARSGAPSSGLLARAYPGKTYDEIACMPLGGEPQPDDTAHDKLARESELLAQPVHELNFTSMRPGGRAFSHSGGIYARKNSSVEPLLNALQARESPVSSSDRGRMTHYFRNRIYGQTYPGVTIGARRHLEPEIAIEQKASNVVEDSSDRMHDGVEKTYHRVRRWMGDTESWLDAERRRNIAERAAKETHDRLKREILAEQQVAPVSRRGRRRK